MANIHSHFDHVGSYLRPQALKEAREAFAQGKISKEELSWTFKTVWSRSWFITRSKMAWKSSQTVNLAVPGGTWTFSGN